MFTPFEIFKLFVLTYFLRNNTKDAYTTGRPNILWGLMLQGCLIVGLFCFVFVFVLLCFIFGSYCFPTILDLYNALCVVPNGLRITSIMVMEMHARWIKNNYHASSPLRLLNQSYKVKNSYWHTFAWQRRGRVIFS